MKIESYAVASSSQREYLKVEAATTLISRQAIAPEQKQTEQEPAKLDLSEKARKFIDEANKNNERFMRKLQITTAPAPGKTRVPSNPTELKLCLLEEMLYRLTGRRFSSRQIDLQNNTKSFQGVFGFENTPGSGTAGTFINTQQFTYESESISYQAQGIIKTADGKTINVDVSMSMTRQYASYSSTSIQMQNSIDPLVISYGGNAATLTGERFAFDLDCDGKNDMISSLGEGSGFLALDRNGDGVINDGSELFGPQSGSGFDDLSAYDSDGNGWIDENDAVFDKLLVWSKDKDGNNQLFSLKELDIGAIFLGEVQTEFSMNGGENENYGTMRSTSFFLKESGGAGTISHIDLTL